MVENASKSKQRSELIYVVAGKEASLVNIQCKELLDQLIAPEERPTGLFNADPAKVSPSAVFDELRTAPFLSKRRVVLIKDADDFVSSHRQLLEKYFDNPSTTGVLLLTVSNWDARTKLAKKLPMFGKLINITQPKPWLLPQHLAGYARDAYDKNLTKTAAELLIELTGDDLGRLYSEIDKLALFADTEKTITPAHVESLISHNRLFNAFEVIKAIGDGKITQAVDKLRSMLAEDKSAEYTFVGAFAFHFRRMFKAKAMLEKGISPAEIANQLRIWANKDAFFAQLGQMTLQQIGDNLEQLAITDHAIKTGQTTPSVAAEQLVFRFASR